MNISAIVMASGLSKRMNQNKLFMDIKNKKIYEYILETIEKCSYLNEVIVVAKDFEILDKASKLRFKIVKNEYSHLGQSVSIKLGLDKSENADGYMFFVADQPFIGEDTIDMLCRIFNDNLNKIIIPCCNGANKNPVIFPKRFKEELLSIEGDIGGKVVIKNNLEHVLKVPIDNESEFIDIDTFEDYESIKMKVFK